MIHAIVAKPRKGMWQDPGKLLMAKSRICRSYLPRSSPASPENHCQLGSPPTLMAGPLTLDAVSRPLTPSDIDRVDNPMFCSRSALFSFSFWVIIIYDCRAVSSSHISPWRSGIPWESLSLLPSAHSCLYAVLLTWAGAHPGFYG